MPVKKFENILISLQQKFWPRPHIHLYGGEPLCHPEFPLFLRYCQRYGYKPTLTTNGDYLKKYAKDIIDSSLTQLNISINHLVNTNKGFDYNAISAIKSFIKFNNKQKILNLNYVIDFNNYNYIEDIVLYFHKNFNRGTFAYFVCQHFMSRNILDEAKKEFNTGSFVNRINRLKKMKLKFDLLFLPNIKLIDLEKYYYSDYRFKNKCFVPWSGFSIYPDLKVTGGGGVLSCNRVLGDLNKQSIKDIWHSDEVYNFRLQILKEGLPISCNRCCHKIYY